MIDREKVIKWLEKIAEFFEARGDMAVGDGKMLLLSWMRAAEDAIALLKAQEPRVMTLEGALAADYVYLEIRLHPNLPCECCILAVERDGDILALKRGFGGYLDREEYGETWRCWTAPPTDEQREATPWK